MSFPDRYIFDLESISVQDALRQIGNAVPFSFAIALGKGLRRVILSDSTKSELSIRTDDVYQYGQHLEDVEMDDSGAESDEMSEFGEAEEEELTVNPAKESEERGITGANTVPDAQPLAVPKLTNDTAIAREDVLMDHEQQYQQPQGEVDTSHHHNKDTGFDIRTINDVDMAAYFLEDDCEDGEDFDDDDFE